MAPEGEQYSAYRVQPAEVAEDFSLVIGGPLFQLFRRAHLSGSSLELLRRRIIFVTIVSWVP